MRRLAASSHSLVRRSVARARHLPPDVAARLARDGDRVVRLFLAESCEDAPADLLLEVWRWWDGSFSHPDRPRSHPDFPRAGLLRCIGDPSGRMRRLALDDPESTPADAVRNPRLPARVLAGLLHDRDTALRSGHQPGDPGFRPAPHPYRGCGSPALNTGTPPGGSSRRWACHSPRLRHDPPDRP
jgi:hypothetical protein